jgi:uncharacterized SAM-binding protein YcdF (DUF218 family)
MTVILFYLKKVIGMLLMPIPLALIFIAIGFWLLRKRPGRARFSLVLAMMILGLSSWHPIADQLIAPVEGDFALFDIRQSVDAVVVLGSSHNSNPNLPAVMQLSGSALFRLEEGLRIARANPNAILLVSGYAGSDPRPHADVMREAAIELGMTPAKILTFPEARDTEDEAKMMAPYLKGLRVALVSEASHLTRAMVFFQNIGLEPIPAPAYRMASDHSDWRIESRATYKSERAIYEWLGRGWQWLKEVI